MGGEMGNESWFSTLRRISHKKGSDEKELIGILSSEIASLMLKVVNLWNCLSDKEVLRLREEMVNSVGIRKLVSEDSDYMIELALSEILEDFRFLGKSVARLGKRCTDPVYHHYEQFVDDPIQNGFQWSGWEYRWKKMEKKVKKMERFIAYMMQLSQELEVLAELEQTLRRMQANPELNRVKLLEFRQKVIWQRQEVRNLRDMSPWNRTYDYIVRLLARSLFTILERTILVFGSNHMPTGEGKNAFLLRSLSFSTFMHSPVHPAENDVHRSYPTTIRKPVLMAMLVADKRRKKKRHHRHLESSAWANVGPFKGCMSGGKDSPVFESCMPVTGGSMRLNGLNMRTVERMEEADTVFFCRKVIYSKLCIKDHLLRAPPSTLGDAALALHYANVIILIERIVSSPHLIDPETRDDLFNMLPTTIRYALRSRLRLYSKTKAPIVYNASLAAEWNHALQQILEWLAPLAHNMMRWHSVRNFEERHMVSKTNVFLVQTLYFANQAKTEATIVELLVGLNYVCRVNREPIVKDLCEHASHRACHSFQLRKSGIGDEII